MTENTNNVNTSTLHLKNKPKTKGVQADRELEVPKHEKADLHERRGVKRTKDFKIQYRTKIEHKDNPLVNKFEAWTVLGEHGDLEQAKHSASVIMNSNALSKMFEYRVVNNKNGKEYLL